MPTPKPITNNQPSNYLWDYLELDPNQDISEQEINLAQPQNGGGGGNQQESEENETYENESEENESETETYETYDDFLEDEEEEETAEESEEPQEPQPQPESQPNLPSPPSFSISPPLITKPKLYEIIDQTITRNFDSWYDFVTCVSDKSLRGYKTINSSHDNDPSSFSFTQTKDFQQAVHMALISGWPEGKELMQAALVVIAPKPEPYKSINYDVAGSYPLVPLFLTGEPGYMMNFETETLNTNPVVKIDYSFSNNAYISTQTLISRGAAVLSLCNILENRGFSVELNLTDNSISQGWSLKVNINFKRAGEPLDLDRAAFALAHPSTLRRLSFALTEQHKELELIFGANYGRATNLPNSTDPDIIFIPPPETNHLTALEHQEIVNSCAEKYLQEERNHNH